MEPVAAAVDAVYAVAEKHLLSRLHKTPFGLALVTETAGVIVANLDKFREEQKTEVILAVLNLLYKSDKVAASLKSLDETTRSKIDNFMTNALPHYVAVMDTRATVPCLPSFSLFNCFTAGVPVSAAPVPVPVAAPTEAGAAVVVPAPAAESLVVRQPGSSLPAASLQSDPRQPEETYEKGSTQA